MLFVCFNRIQEAVIKVKNFSMSDILEEIKVQNTKNITDIIEAKLEYFVILNIKYQDNSIKTAIIGYITLIPAIKVDTPLPPLNNKKIENICPKIKKCIHTLAKVISIYFDIKYNGMAHFEKSSINAIIPIFFPRILVTFVAPIFPDPESLISHLKKIFDINNPNGIEPLKYEKNININHIKFIFSIFLISLRNI